MLVGWAELVDQWMAVLNSNLGDYGPIGIQVLKIIWINILLSGDNAVVIALACRALPRRQRLWGIILGAGAASSCASSSPSACNSCSRFRRSGSSAAYSCSGSPPSFSSRRRRARTASPARDTLWGAVRTVAIADIVMSLDNVLAIAAAAKGHPWLIGFGLLVSIPLIVAGATLIMALLARFPILVWAGAGLLGWIAGELLMEDPVSRPYLDQLGMDYGLDHKATEIVMQIACALFVLLCGWLLMKWQSRAGRQATEQKSAAE